MISDNVEGKPPLKVGSEFTCKAELMLKVVAVNELHHRRFTARNGSKNEGGGGGGISCRNCPFDYEASCCGNGDCTFLVKVRCVLLLCMCVRSCVQILTRVCVRRPGISPVKRTLFSSMDVHTHTHTHTHGTDV
jgi:hypothetical protein